ncbi:uncharacterized protein LOC131324029 [Rhododendron vialii]|uniref:uncharacterized protein LOC131324029 n=1 Tax=Rhododendron vialii TaxID=182163 RepID=UPI00265E36CE|nr:uncharacterized protein LOC131324029 [Rhododendron vialii]
MTLSILHYDKRFNPNELLNIHNEFVSPVALAPNNDKPILKVGDLFLDGGRSWNEEKIDSLFPWEVGNAIKLTPISWSGGEDMLTWKIWNLKSPPRLKHVLWRIIRNAVSTKENLFARKCARSPICGLCGAKIETIEHVLLRCEWTKEVWANSGIEFPTPVNREVSVKKWFVSLLVEWGGQFSERMGLIGQICWAVWKQRNEWVFLQQMPNAKINVPAHNHGDSNVPKWQRPLNGSWKFNCDGAFNPSDKSTAFAVLVRDENGSVVEINHGRIKVSSALAAEAWAIWIAVSMALAWGKKDAVIESNCQPLVNMLQPKSVLKNWTIQAILDDIFSFSANSNFVFSWCNRQANRCANWIAYNSRLGVGIPLAPCNLPVELCSLIRSDL